ncbi:unnamed protein product [Fraxinus pennsylvanica]|uniref:Uncharacterized protein n=1 Tax=Fraxinus pennsylvanica TaxID=56036 RepID=A0AAD2AH35_9LAMI|nr:unnamed protein product [Fraxinus pennsylvanica]
MRAPSSESAVRSCVEAQRTKHQSEEGDPRLVHYLPSIIAGATMVYVIREIEPCNGMEYQNQLMSVLRISKHARSFVGKCSPVVCGSAADEASVWGRRLVHYLPPVIAGETMVYVIREIEPCNGMEYQNQLMSVLRISKEYVYNMLQFSYGWYFTFVQGWLYIFLIYLQGFTPKQMVNPWKTYVKLSAMLMDSNGLTKGSLAFLNYPA